MTCGHILIPKQPELGAIEGDQRQGVEIVVEGGMNKGIQENTR